MRALFQHAHDSAEFEHFYTARVGLDSKHRVLYFLRAVILQARDVDNLKKWPALCLYNNEIGINASIQKMQKNQNTKLLN